MSLLATCVVLALVGLAFAAANLMSRRPRPLGEVGLVPWTGIQFVLIIVAAVLLAHLFSLLLGRDIPGRFGPPGR